MQIEKMVNPNCDNCKCTDNIEYFSFNVNH